MGRSAGGHEAVAWRPAWVHLRVLGGGTEAGGDFPVGKGPGFMRSMRRDFGMNETLAMDVIYLAAFCLGGLVFAVAPFAVVHLLSARRTRQTVNKTDQAIECGMDPIGDAWIRYSAVYYRYALVFVAFAADVLFLLPVALVYDDPQFVVRDLVELLLFVGILSLVIVYAWKKGVFEWKNPPSSTAPPS